MNREITECFKSYKKAKVDEYTMNFDGHKTIPHCVIYKNKDKKLYNTVPFLSQSTMAELHRTTGRKGFPNKTVIHKSLVERLSPDNIDSREFWKKATDLYPLFSICGGEPKEHTVEAADAANYNMHRGMGAVNILGHYINELLPEREVEMLEIGPGFGNICRLTSSVKSTTGNSINYHAIDVNPLFEHPNIHQTDGSTIPEEVPNDLDVVYSINVFQHLSKKQRSAYYKQIAKKLKVGGMFIFSMFVCTEANKDWSAWGVRDKDERRYTFFFRQFTEVDFYEEIQEEMEGLGFEFNNVSLHEDKLNSLMFKCIKK